MRVNVSSAAVFGSYLRPDLVPANPSFYEGSSMGTISTSSIFVNLDNQTEERYCLFSLCTRSYCCHYSVTPCWLSAGKNKYFITLKQWCKVPVHNTTLRAGREASRLATPNTHTPTLLPPLLWHHMVFLVTCVTEQVTQACLATRVQYTHAHFLHNIRTVQLKDGRCDGGNCHSLLSTRHKNKELYKHIVTA